MRIILSTLLLLIFSCTQSKTQKPENIVNAFKQKNIEFIIDNSSLPFRIQVGSSEDDENVTSKEVLRNKLKLLFEKKYFKEILLWKRLESTGEEIILGSRSFNKAGELESESTFTFSFKKSKNGRLELYALMLAG